MWQKTVAAALVLCGAQGFGYALCQEMKCMLYHDTELWCTGIWLRIMSGNEVHVIS